MSESTEDIQEKDPEEPATHSETPLDPVETPTELPSLDRSDREPPSPIKTPTIEIDTPVMAQPHLVQTVCIPVVGPSPVQIECPQCHRLVTSKLHHRPTALTHISCLLMLPFCLCCMPYYLNTFRTTDHSCPICNAYLGTYH